jgi:mono/diheme cytochrome c family protein
MAKSHLITGAALLAGFGIFSARQNFAQEKPKDASSSGEIEYKPTPEDLAKKNPVASTTEGLAEARKLYGYHCAMCHGEKGDGKGDLALQMKLQLNDWRDPSALKDKTDAVLFYIVSNGKGKMVGGEGDRTSEKVRWNLVNVVRSFAKKDAGEKTKAPASQ